MGTKRENGNKRRRRARKNFDLFLSSNLQPHKSSRLVSFVAFFECFFHFLDHHLHFHLKNSLFKESHAVSQLKTQNFCLF